MAEEYPGGFKGRKITPTQKEDLYMVSAIAWVRKLVESTMFTDKQYIDEQTGKWEFMVRINKEGVQSEKVGVWMEDGVFRASYS